MRKLWILAALIIGAAACGAPEVREQSDYNDARNHAKQDQQYMDRTVPDQTQGEAQ